MSRKKPTRSYLILQCDSYASFVLRHLPSASVTRQMHPNHEPTVKSRRMADSYIYNLRHRRDLNQWDTIMFRLIKSRYFFMIRGLYKPTEVRKTWCKGERTRSPPLCIIYDSHTGSFVGAQVFSSYCPAFICFVNSPISIALMPW